MKGKKKLILPLLLAGATVATGYVAPVYQSVSATTTNGYNENTSIIGEAVKVEGFKDTYKVGDDVFLPVVPGVDFKVTKGGKEIEIKTATETIDGHNAGDKYFEAKYEGYYNIEITSNAENKVKTTIENMTIWVEKSEASIVLPVNSTYVIPAKMGKGQSGFKIPAPSVLIGDDEEPTEVGDLATGTTLDVVVYKPNGTKFNTTYNATGKYFEVNSTDLDKAGTYTIVYEYKEGETVVASLDNNFQVVNEYDTSKIKLTMSLQDSVPTTGNVNTEVKVPKVKVTESKSSLDAINAYVKVKITNTTTGKVLDDSKFDYEKYSFVPEENGNYVVTYKASIDLFGLTSSEVTPGQSIKVSDTESATVRLTYDYTVDATDPSKIIAINGMPISNETEEEIDAKLENIEYLIPSVVKLEGTGENKKATITLPAIYGTDNLDKLNDITFTRSYYNQSTGTVTTIDAPSNMGTTIDLTKAGKYEIRYKAVDKKGNTPGNRGYRTYTVIVKDADDDISDGTTKVNLSIPYSTISDKDKTLTFAVPTATDTYDEEIQVKTFYNVKGETGNLNSAPIELTDDDKNTAGKYSIDIKELLTSYSGAKSIEVYAEAYVDGALVGTRDAFAEGTVVINNSLTIKTQKGTGSNASEPQDTTINRIVVKSDVKTIELVDSMSDSTPATISVVGDNWNTQLYEVNKSENNDKLTMFEQVIGETTTATNGINEKGFAVNGSTVLKLDELDQSAFDQGSDIIKLPKVQFKDKDSNLAISVTIKNLYGNVVSKYTSEKITSQKTGDDYVYTIDNLSFRLSNYGVYTITYTAKDIGGNITAQTFGVRVNNKTKPTLKIDDEDQFGSEIEVGKKFDVPTANVIRDGEEVIQEQIEYITWEIESSSEFIKVGDTGFVPLAEGSFKVIYRAKVRGVDEVTTLGNSSFTLTAKDTTAPSLSLNGTFIPAMAWEEDANEDYQTITIPSAFADDGKFDGIDYGYGKSVEVVYSVSGPSSTTPDVSPVDGDMSQMKFKASKQGTYTVKYTATDDSGNTTTITKELKLGDCEAPELTWDNDEDIPVTAELNKEFSIDLGKITLTDEGGDTDEDYLNENLSVTLTDPSGNTVTKTGSASHPSWKIESTGNYTLKFVVKDNVGNTNTYSYKVNVPAEEVEEEKISPVVGTILVVVAVAVLAGVVVYFVVSSRKKPSASKKSSRKAKK